MKRVLASILLLAMLLALCACSSSGTPTASDAAEAVAPGSSATAPDASNVTSSSKTTPADTFVYATNGEPGNLDPQNNTYLMGQIITNCIYDTLVTRNAETGEIFPALATDWEFTDDTHLRLSIREDVSFHNGDKLTVDDVVYSIQRMCASSASSSYYGFINADDTKALDDTTVEIAMNYAFSGALNFLSNPRGAIVSKSYTEQGGDDTMARAPMETGAFIFDEWVEGDRVNCHRNDNYWGDKPSYTNLTVRFIADAATRFIELETGGVDACDNISGSNYSRMLSGVDGCVLYDTLSTKTFYIVCNDEHDVVSNVNVRKALAYALDLPAIVKAAYGDSATVADSSVAATLPFYESQAQYYTYDPEAAKACLAEAGYSDGLDLTLVLEEVTELVNLAEAAQSYWKAVGINVEIQVYDIATAGTMCNTGEAYFTIRNCGCASGDPSQCYNFFDESYGGTNAILDPVFNEMLDKAAVITDTAERNDAYKEIQRYVAENCYEIPLLTPIFAYGTRDYVTFFDADPSNVPNLKSVTFAQ